jgi:hypothetical protein
MYVHLATIICQYSYEYRYGCTDASTVYVKTYASTLSDYSYLPVRSRTGQ